MQEKPLKTVFNYNEFESRTAPRPPVDSEIKYQTEALSNENWYEALQRGHELVNSEVDRILGADNMLIRGEFVYPSVFICDEDPTDSGFAGYFSSGQNEIVLISKNIGSDPLARTKVFIHEYLHFLSHNGWNDDEIVNSESPLAQKNNVGFNRNFGLDVREGNEGNSTHHYFLSFNEAVTEQLAIDILPGVGETYHQYRELLNQVIDDAVARGIGSSVQDGTFRAWSSNELKQYIYVCFFKGDLAGFTSLLQTTYEKFELSEQQFGLMTHKSDLPSMIEQKLIRDHPNGPPPSPAYVSMLVQQRLDRKTVDDYFTDVVDSGIENAKSSNGDESSYGVAYDSYINENNILISSTEQIEEGIEYDIDNQGLIVYRGDQASVVLDYITSVFNGLLLQLEKGEIEKDAVTANIDELLFHQYKMSMLSEGFRDFYIYKHEQIDRI